jgi:prevent-host-death family protein
MAIVTALEAKTHFGRILDRVADGEEIIITRHDKPVARMIPEGRESLATVRDAVSGLRELRAKMARRKGYRALADAELKAARNQGRRERGLRGRCFGCRIVVHCLPFLSVDRQASGRYCNRRGRNRSAIVAL